MAEDKDIKTLGLALDGKLVKSEHPALIGKNFSVLQNMRYRKASIESVYGMSKINTAGMPRKVEPLDVWTEATDDYAGEGATFTPSAGTNRLALISIAHEDNNTGRLVTGLTLGGRTCTNIDEQVTATAGMIRELVFGIWKKLR